MITNPANAVLPLAWEDPLNLFHDELNGSLSLDGTRFTTATTMTHIDIDPDARATTTIVIPSGFETDFASIPRFGWSLIPPWGKMARPALLHDFLYFNGPNDRAWADRVFRRAMRAAGVNPVTERTVYYSVRWFAGKAWRESRKTTARRAIISDDWTSP